MYKYFNKDKSDLVDLERFLYEFDFQTILKSWKCLIYWNYRLTNFKKGVQGLSIGDINKNKKD
ncbi:hypothetical protein [Borreliella garinii]|uniref:hypothetical protein n=1 Tax=Borreliella garinii TaxID=29519 RepID=UPI00018ACF0B|nr:hypothetical protein [Borreliella garinii]ACL34961.1 putative beta-N-acetylhexosaminidase [Borreliella garinii Far04]WNZ69161.1 hypothetical protein PT138_05010 [Borreliella garinii]WNZ70162.1 hypothetical protein PT140_04990 [Borreliella garinii]WNZ71166.1 hypothetical protein PT141_05020 [Borreliella garinii]